MNPVAARSLVLVIEITVFFVMTAFIAQFISLASALHPGPGEAPPAHFPVVVHEGDRASPAPEHYRVMTWSEWEAHAAARPQATLLLPQQSATLRQGETQATFTAVEQSPERQAVELKWRADGGEQEAHYFAQARSIEPSYLRTLGTRTILMAALAGFVVSLLIGRALRARWLTGPRYVLQGRKP